MPNPIVIDLSHWNPTPNWATLKASGTLGVIHKATQGTDYVDDQLFARARPAMDAGLAWATYHYLEAGDIEAQMRHYYATIDPRPGERMIIDHESDASLDELKEAVRLLLAAPRLLEVSVYSGHTIKEQLGSTRDDFLADNTSLWLSHYTSGTPTWPDATWPVWSLWQYTDRASYSGVSQPCDGNKWNGTSDQLIKWFGPAGVEPVPPSPPPPDQPVVSLGLSIEPPPAVLRVFINGTEYVEASA